MVGRIKYRNEHNKLGLLRQPPVESNTRLVDSGVLLVRHAFSKEVVSQVFLSDMLLVSWYNGSVQPCHTVSIHNHRCREFGNQLHCRL